MFCTAQAYEKFPILEYHLIGTIESRWTRTPDNFKKDLLWLYNNNYYPANLKDILNGFKDVPKDKTPVVLTFDDSSIGQFNYLSKDKIDPNSAVGIFKTFHDKHGNSWPMKGTFFVLIETNCAERNLFGQKEFAQQKLQQLTKWGMEVGSHTYCHDRLDKLSDKMAIRTLGWSNDVLKRLSGSDIVSLALPLGKCPKNMAVLSGKYNNSMYNYKVIALVGGGLQKKTDPNTKQPIAVNRIQAMDSEFKTYLKRKDN